MVSEGLIVNEPESIPSDPYTEGRNQPLRTFTTKSDFDKLKKFLTLDRKVNIFFDRLNIFWIFFVVVFIWFLPQRHVLKTL